MDVSATDQLMTLCRGRILVGDDLDVALAALETAHYRLLSLPAWDEQDEAIKLGQDFRVYECCRLTAILYSNCVIHPILYWSSGMQNLLWELRKIVETYELFESTTDGSALLVWALFIAGIAAYKTTHRDAFVSMLRDVLIRQGITSLQMAVNIARQFLWSDCACEDSAAVLWNALKLDPHT